MNGLLHTRRGGMSRGQRKPELKVQWNDEKGKELAQVHKAKLLVLCKPDTGLFNFTRVNQTSFIHKRMSGQVV